jgi:hypothetical protein
VGEHRGALGRGAKGYIARGGQMIDATIVPVPDGATDAVKAVRHLL